jgi:hypothetical protein
MFDESLGCSAGLDCETRIMVKENAPVLLRKIALNGRRDYCAVASAELAWEGR